jgi:hypothetical protein
MPNFGTLVLGPHEIRRFSAEIRFAEYRRSRISLLSLWQGREYQILDFLGNCSSEAHIVRP